LKVVTQSWLRKEPTPELGSSDHPVFCYKIWMHDADVNVDEEEWHLDVDEDNIQDTIDINMDETEDAIDAEEIVKE
jgi:hypothetical protein